MNLRRSMRHAQLLALGLVLILAACAGAPELRKEPPFPLAAEGQGFGKEGLSGFAAESLRSFSTFTLSNGIPVVLKKSQASRVQHLSLVVRGGVLLAQSDRAGLESLALKTMARGSKRYAYSDIQSLLDETSSSISAGSTFESSNFSLNTLDKYFARLLPVWADCLAAPAFTEEDFEQVLSEARLALQSKEQDPWAKAGLVMNAEFFAGHPYAIPPEGTKESLAAVSLDELRKWYESAFSANRCFVIAVGDFDPASLRDELEATIGKLPDRKLELPAPAPGFNAGAQSRLVKVEYPQSKGVGYIRGDFPAPAPADPDYMATNIAMKMLSDLLFNVVRDKYGATYSPGAYIRGFGANYGSIIVYKTKVASKVKAYLDEAMAELAAGRVLSVDPTFSEGAYPRMPIAAALPIYKALFMSGYYEAQQTNAQVAAQIAASVLSTGDYRSYLHDMEKIEAVKPEEISAVIDTYLLRGGLTWVVLGSKDVIEPVNEADYRGF